MATMADLRGRLCFREPVRMQVLHPQYGAVEVLAYCEMDAQLQAAEAWDVPWVDICEGAKLAVETAALRALAVELGLA